MVATLGVDNSSSWVDATVDQLVETYEKTIVSLLAPNRLMKFLVRLSNVWFDDDFRAAKRLARLRERNYAKSKLPADRTLWTTQLHSYHRLCDMKRSLFWKFQIESNSSNPKKMWRSINTVLGRTNQSVRSKFAAADFAEFFNTKGEKIRKDTENAPPPSYTD